MKSTFCKWTVAILAMLCSFGMQAQEETQGKSNVFIDYFTTSCGASKAEVTFLRNQIIHGLQDTKRIAIIDIDTNDILKKEYERRGSNNIALGDDMECLAVMTQEGAHYLIQGNLDVLGCEAIGGSASGYKGYIDYTIKVIDPRNGKLIAAKNFSHGRGMISFLTAGTRDEVLTEAISKAKGDMKKFVDEVFKIQGTVLELDNVEKGKAKSLFISLGSDQGVAKDNEFIVYISREIQGRASLKAIGKVKVKAVEGPELSWCEVKEGGKDIYDAFNSGQKVVVVSKEKGKNAIDATIN